MPTPTVDHFLISLSNATLKEAYLLIKYASDEHLLIFKEIARNLLDGSMPTPASLTPYHDQTRALSAARTPAKIRKIFLGEDLTLHSTTATDFFNDLADANEKEGRAVQRGCSAAKLVSKRYVDHFG
jgi:hypothetical protein